MSTILCHDETHGNVAEITNPTPDKLNNMGMEGYEEESAEAEADTFAAEGAAASGSRMISRGKAAKIGITLLAILAIIAGVVVLSPKKSNDTPTAVSSSQQQVKPDAKATAIVTPQVSPTPSPTVKKPQNKEKSEKKTKEPKPAPISTPFPTDEGTATVSTETTGPPTLQPRESVRTLKGQGK
ncbi:hypothetical protein ACHAWC_004961 [Mediolabrus comicus]